MDLHSCHALLDYVQNAVVGLDLQFVVNYWNHAAEALLGWTAEETIGRSSIEIISPSNFNMQQREQIRQFTDEHEPFAFKGIGHTKDGQRLDLFYTVVLLHETDGKAKGYAVLIQNISEDQQQEIDTQAHEAALRKSEAALRKSEGVQRESQDQLSEVLESISDGFFAVDQDWFFTYVNQRTAGNAGVQPQEMTGKNMWALFPAFQDTSVANYYRQVMETRVPVHFKTDRAFRGRWFDVSVYPSGNGISVYHRDITEQVRVEQALQEREAELRKSAAVLHDSQAELRRSDAHAQRSLALLRNLYSSTPIGLCFYDTELRYQAVNDMLAKINGLPTSAHIGKTVGEIIPAEVAGPLTELLQQVLASGQPVMEQFFSTLHLDTPVQKGEWLLSFHPLFAEDGQKLGVSCVVQDITGRKQAEEALRASQHDLAHAQAVANTGSWRLDLYQNALLWSDEAYNIFGIPVGTPLTYEVFLDAVHPDDRDFVDRSWQAALNGEPYDIEHRILANGQVKWVRERAELEIGPQGQLQGGFGTVQEITERKQAEEALLHSEATLRESNERFRQLADAMPQLVWTANAEGAMDYLNQRLQEYEGLVQGADGTWDWLPALHPEDQAPALRAWQEAVAAGETFNREMRLHMRDGSYRWHLSRGIPIHGPMDDPIDGPAGGPFSKVVRWFGTATDIHEQKLTEDQLRRSNQELEQFAFVASHDLQEPLRKIKLFGNSLRRSLGDDLSREGQDYLGRMQSAADRMQAMISGLLDLSRVSTQGSNFTLVNLTQLARDAVSNLEVSLQATQGQVTVEDLPTAEVDVMQIRQLFQNLIGNALKFHKPDEPPRVKVSGFLTRSGYGGSLTVTVEDNGIGFEERYAERVFQPFQRLHGRSEFEGTGMGLSICQKIVERHHGLIEVHSTPGVGSSFIIRLPLRQDGPRPCLESLPASPPRRGNPIL